MRLVLWGRLSGHARWRAVWGQSERASWRWHVVTHLHILLWFLVTWGVTAGRKIGTSFFYLTMSFHSQSSGGRGRAREIPTSSMHPKSKGSAIILPVLLNWSVLDYRSCMIHTHRVRRLLAGLGSTRHQTVFRQSSPSRMGRPAWAVCWFRAESVAT